MNCKHVRFVGGGRWATIVLTELVKTFPSLVVDWVSHSDLKNKCQIIEGSSFYKNISVVDGKNIESLNEPDKVIIASHSSQHCNDFITYKDEPFDILMEKPLFPYLSGFTALSDQRLGSVSINLEFYNAYFITDFYEEIKALPVNEIDIVWHDPLCEERLLQEGKYSEIYSSIFMDQLFHVMSICKRLDLDAKKFSNIKVINKNSHDVKIQCDLNDIVISISLSRFADKRERKIILNDGALELDFCGKANVYDDGEFKKELLPSGRLFPIAQTLKHFVNDTRSASELSLKSLMPVIEFCFDCEDIFMASMADQLATGSLDDFNPDDMAPDLVYYAGIMYYRQLSENSPLCNVHFLKGDVGVRELGHWWAGYCNERSSIS